MRFREEVRRPLSAPRIVTDVPGPRSRELVASEADHLAPGIQSISTLSGIAVARAEGSVIEDVDGNRFLDLAAGICVNALGHSHPRYRQILKDQIDEVAIGSFTTARRAKALARVVAHTPPGLDKLQLYSGGTEAVEAALRLAKSYTKKYEFLAFWGGFHGKTAGSLSLIGDGTKNGLGPSLPGTYHAPYADCYRCPLALEYPSCGIECAQLARKVVKNSTTGALAAVLIEPIQGTAGNVVPPPEFMPIGESLNVECVGGLMQRAERLVLTCLVCLLDPALSARLGVPKGTCSVWVLAVIAVSSTVTAVHRTAWISRRLLAGAKAKG